MFWMGHCVGVEYYISIFNLKTMINHHSKSDFGKSSAYLLIYIDKSQKIKKIPFSNNLFSLQCGFDKYINKILLYMSN